MTTENNFDVIEASYILEARDAFLDCAVWADLDENDNGSRDFYPDVFKHARDFVAQFYAETREIVGDFKISAEDFGHNLWLTMQGHGTGFWDRDYPGSIGDELTTLAEGYRDQHDLYRGDDGYLYIAGMEQ